MAVIEKNILSKNTVSRTQGAQDIGFCVQLISPNWVNRKYSGNHSILRRSSDDDEQTFGFVDGVVDTTSIASWAGGDTIYVKQVYDQSGYGNDWVQTTKANQPVWDNTNKQFAYTAASSQYFSSSDNNSLDVSTNDFSVVAGVEFDSLPSDSHIFMKGLFATPRTYWRTYYFAGALKFAVEDISAPEQNVNFANPSLSTPLCLSSIKDGQFVKAYTGINLDNSLDIGSGYGTLDNTPDLFLGGANGGVSGNFDGKMRFFALYRKALSTAEITLIDNEL